MTNNTHNNTRFRVSFKWLAIGNLCLIALLVNAFAEVDVRSNDRPPSNRIALAQLSEDGGSGGFQTRKQSEGVDWRGMSQVFEWVSSGGLDGIGVKIHSAQEQWLWPADSRQQYAILIQSGRGRDGFLHPPFSTVAELVFELQAEDIKPGKWLHIAFDSIPLEQGQWYAFTLLPIENKDGLRIFWQGYRAALGNAYAGRWQHFDAVAAPVPRLGAIGDTGHDLTFYLTQDGDVADSLHQPTIPGVAHPPQPVLAGRTARIMRYQPEEGGFVIENGNERFNRPLYIGHDGARLDAGDRPEFAFYRPGKGGVLRLGLRSPEGDIKWLLDADTVVTQYREGRKIYRIKDAFLSEELQIDVVPASGIDRSAVLRITYQGQKEADLIWAYGGATGRLDFRGDLGYTDLVRHFDLRVQDCEDSEFNLDEDKGFTLVSANKEAVVSGQFSALSKIQLADATAWNSPAQLFETPFEKAPIAVGSLAISASEPVYILLRAQKLPEGEDHSLSEIFDNSLAASRAVSEQIKVRTPDPYVNAIVPALNVAANALWDGQHRYAHGNVAWRRSYFGWRVAYAGDALGWHERTRAHLRYAFSRQLIHSGDDEPPVEFKSDGYFYEDWGRIYNWNPKLIDALMRHINWTGDRDFAKEAWPYLQRHLERENRLFRRGDLYDSVVSIWASDALNYNFGQVTHTSSMHHYHHRMAAMIASVLGKDSTVHYDESTRIRKALNEQLWLSERGAYGEFRDTWGEQRVHPSAALWTLYHTIDSQVPDALQAWQMTHEMKQRLARIPIHGRGTPVGDWFVLPVSDWTPYVWSINLVATGELYHTALALWQAGRHDLAWQLFMGTSLESMFRGTCPGNIAMTLSLDAYNGEKIRDFGFISIMSRAVVEGLFGVRPSLLENKLLLKPGWPADWEEVSFAHPSLSYDFVREGNVDTYLIEPKFDRPITLSINLPVRMAQLEVFVDGTAVEYKNDDTAVGEPRVVVEIPNAQQQVEVTFKWGGDKLAALNDGTAPVIHSASQHAGLANANLPAPAQVSEGERVVLSIAEATAAANIVGFIDPQSALEDVVSWKKGFSARIKEGAGPKTVFIEVEQNGWQWLLPWSFEVLPALEIVTNTDARQTPVIEGGEIHFRLRNNTRGHMKTQGLVSVAGRDYPIAIDAAARGGMTKRYSIKADEIPPGNRLIKVSAAGLRSTGTVANWARPSANFNYHTLALETLFNSRATEIFAEGKYSRESFPLVGLKGFDLLPEKENQSLPGISIGIPSTGMGNWIKQDFWQQFKAAGGINDEGLRRRASEGDGIIYMQSGVPFALPTDSGSKNIAMVSQWDNYPRELTLPLKGRARHAYLLMAGTTYHMQSRIQNGEIRIRYTDGSYTTLPLNNPESWWPIHRDYFVDDFAFRIESSRPPRFRLDSGEEYHAETHYIGGVLGSQKSHLISGGAATVLDIPLDPAKDLESLTLIANANEVLIGLMGVTLVD